MTQCNAMQCNDRRTEGKEDRREGGREDNRACGQYYVRTGRQVNRCSGQDRRNN